MDDSLIGEMGHWEVGSAMPRQYDSACCVSELLNKSKVLECVYERLGHCGSRLCPFTCVVNFGFVNVITGGGIKSRPPRAFRRCLFKLGFSVWYVSPLVKWFGPQHHGESPATC